MKRPVLIALSGAILVAGGFGIIHWRESASRPSTETDAPREVSGRPAPLDQKIRKQEVSSAGKGRLRRVEALVARGAEAVPDLADALASAESPAEKEEYADALMEIGTPEALQVFAEAWLGTESPTLREGLAESLKGLQSDVGLEMVASILSLSDDPIVVGAVNDTLSRMADADSIEFLAELYEEGVENQDGLRSRIVDAVSGIANPGAVASLTELIERGDSKELSLAAADGLAEIGTEAAVTNLVELIRDEEASRELYDPLLDRLASIISPHSAAILTTVAESDPSEEIRQAASRALAEIKAGDEIDPNAVRASAEELTNPAPGP